MLDYKIVYFYSQLKHNEDASLEKKRCKGLQERSSTVCVTEITLLNQDP
jgi:hypothetical protein